MKYGLGPVFGNEWLTTSRRWQVYAGRALFVAALLVGLWSVWVSRVSGQQIPTIQLQAFVGQGFFMAIVFTQMTLILLIAPAATAGSICQDRSSGKLIQLLGTDLSDSEIVLGKLAARILPVVGLVCCALPVLALCSLLGGVDPLALAGAFAVTVSLAVFGCALALTFSVWASKPYEVLMATYGCFGIWLLAIPIWDFLGSHWGFATSPDWTIPSHPFYLAFAPYVQPGKVGPLGFLAFMAGMAIASALLAAVAIWKMREVVTDEKGETGSAIRADASETEDGTSNRRWFGLGASPVLDRNPILWYEARRKQQSPWVRTMIRIYYAIAVGFTMVAIFDIIRPGVFPSGWLCGYVVSFQVVIGLPIVLLSAVTALVEERARGSLDVLLATPLSTRQIVLAKWWSAFRDVPRLLILPTIVTIAAAWQNASWIPAAALGAAIISAAAFWTSLGLAISTSVPRLGRAVSLAVGIYAIVSLAWPILTKTVFPREGSGLAAVSPFYGCFDLTVSLFLPDYVSETFPWILGWITCQAVAAVLLLAATLATFDRSLGRMQG